MPNDEFDQPRPAQPKDDAPESESGMTNVMEVSVTFEGEVPEEVQPDFASLANAMGGLFGRLASTMGIDHLDVECVLAHDFREAVESRLRRLGDGDQQGFTTERVGGVVVGKNLPQVEDQSRIAVVFAPELWIDSGGFAPAQKVATMAHEIAHTVMSRARYMSGALEGVVFPSQTLTEVARSSARIDWDEFRAEALADTVLQTVATTGEGDNVRPLRLADFASTLYHDQASSQLAAAYPAWADRVDAYMDRQISLDDLWYATLQKLGQLRTLIAMFTGAMGRESDQPLAADLSAQHAYRLYFGEPWEEYVRTMRVSPILPTVSEHRGVEAEVLRVGEGSFRAALLALGLTADDLPNRTAYVHVSEPRRIDS